MEEYLDGFGHTVLVHSKDKCEGRNCVIHNPSDHPLRKYPTSWDDDRRLMYRVLEEQHIKIIDPDEMEYQKRRLTRNSIVLLPHPLDVIEREKCPECGNGVLVPQNSGVKCNKCSYCFCY